jgi:HSP20 family protein
MFGPLRGFEVSLFDFGAAGAAVDTRMLPRGAFPALDVVITPQQVDVYLKAPGIDAKSLDLSIQQNVLSVSGRREAQVEDKAARHRLERFSGEFRRVVTLPEDVDSNRVTASYVDGIVQITVQRHEAAKPRRIEIH